MGEYVRRRVLGPLSRERGPRGYSHKLLRSLCSYEPLNRRFRGEDVPYATSLSLVRLTRRSGSLSRESPRSSFGVLVGAEPSEGPSGPEGPFKGLPKGPSSGSALPTYGRAHRALPCGRFPSGGVVEDPCPRVLRTGPRRAQRACPLGVYAVGPQLEELIGRAFGPSPNQLR